MRLFLYAGIIVQKRQRWAAKLYLTLPTVQILLPVTFGCPPRWRRTSEEVTVEMTDAVTKILETFTLDDFRLGLHLFQLLKQIHCNRRMLFLSLSPAGQVKLPFMFRFSFVSLYTKDAMLIHKGRNMKSTPPYEKRFIIWQKRRPQFKLTPWIL